MSSKVNKALADARGLTESIEGENLYHSYEAFLNFHQALIDAVQADFIAESDGLSRNETTRQLIQASTGLDTMIARLRENMLNYRRYMTKNALGTEAQRNELDSFREQFLSYDSKIKTLATQARAHRNSTSNKNTYKYGTKTKGYENHRANAVGLKTGRISAKDSININRFRKLLIEVLPPRWGDRLRSEVNVGVGNLFGKNNNENCSTTGKPCSIMGGRRKMHTRRHKRSHSKTHKRSRS